MAKPIKPIQQHDKEKLDEAMEKLVEQAIAEAEKTEPKTEVPTQERELVNA
jgi:adenine-specific DNA methylase